MKRIAPIGLSVVLLGLFALLTARVAVAADADVVKKMDETKVTLAKAIEAAEAGSKGKATAALARLDGDKLAFLVHTVVGDKTMEVLVDGTGKAAPGKDASELSVRTLNAMKPADVWKAMEAAKFTLASAISAAEADAKGKAIGVKSKKENDKVVFDVSVVSGDKTQSVLVDHTTGKVVKK